MAELKRDPVAHEESNERKEKEGRRMKVYV